MLYVNIMFSALMADKEIIISLGGPTRVAELLELDKTRGGVQRVQNWMKRGIPAKVKLSRPDLFLKELLDGSVKDPRSGERRKAKYGRRATDKKNSP